MHQSLQIDNGNQQRPLIQMSDVSKTFGGNKALDNVSLKLMPGTVHALMGENGAGKSTLMKILAGVVECDHGTIHMNGTVLKIRNPKEALDFGISTVFQELSLLPNLSIAENMFLGKEQVNRFGRVDKKTMEERTAATLKEINLNLDPATLVSELTIAERQFVEIARGISANAQVIILDEPTAALNSADVEILNRHIRNLKSQGAAIVYISHRMEEIFEVCDCVTVLKDGRHVATSQLCDLTPQSLVAMMVGRNIEDLFPQRQPIEKALVRLSIKNLQLTASAKPISLSLNSGEIVGIAGLEGQGQRELLRSLIGQYQCHSGAFMLRGKEHGLPLQRSTGIRELQSLGVGFVPEDRKDEGLFLDLSIYHNISIGLNTATSEIAWVSDYGNVVKNVMAEMVVKAPNSLTEVRSLSGGNQQKVLLGRYLATGADILLIEEPTRGVDVGAKAEIYKLLRSFANTGGAILVLSRETVELIGLCDRLLVVHKKTIVSEMEASEATEHKILEAALCA